MADGKPSGSSQAQEPAETDARSLGRRLKDRRREFAQRRGAFRDARVSAYGRAQQMAGRRLEPVTKPWGVFRENVEANRRWAYPLIGILVIAAAAMLPFLTEWFDLPDWARRATSGSALARVALFTLFALGLNVVVGFAGLLDLGYVAFWLIGSYTAGILTGAHSYTQAIAGEGVAVEPTWSMWMWLIILAALMAAVIAGVVLGSPTLRLRGDYLAIVTLGFGEILRITANNLDNITGGPRGVRGIPHPAIRVGELNI
ncbi:MAG: hypothetical protein ABR505_00005, partial [Actinomycetota bacterium]